MSAPLSPDELAAVEFAVRRLERKDADGPQYGVGVMLNPWPQGAESVVAWFVVADDALAYARPMRLPVWDLVEGRRIDE